MWPRKHVCWEPPTHVTGCIVCCSNNRWKGQWDYSNYGYRNWYNYRLTYTDVCQYTHHLLSNLSPGGWGTSQWPWMRWVLDDVHVVHINGVLIATLLELVFNRLFQHLTSLQTHFCRTSLFPNTTIKQTRINHVLCLLPWGLHSLVHCLTTFINDNCIIITTVIPDCMNNVCRNTNSIIIKHTNTHTHTHTLGCI